MTIRGDLTTSIRGDLLSCYSASIAAYMESQQIDHQLALGSQLFLAISAEEDDSPQLTFVHYHTPLLGNTITHSLHLARQSSADQDTALRRIIAHCQQRGPVIVSGDARRLPWLVTYGRRHAPHWFLITAIDREAEQWQLVDLFEFVDAGGTQLPFVGAFDLAQLDTLAQTCSEQQHVFRARDQWAFGAHEPLPDASATYQWFEWLSPPVGHALTDAQRWELLANTWRFHSGQQQRADLPPSRWSCGLAAIERLARIAERYLDCPELYEISDDVWVAARHRQLFVHVIQRLSVALSAPELGALAVWCEAELVPQWHALPRVMHYNSGSLKRGRPPNRLLIQTLDTIVAQETQLVEQLGQILRDRAVIR